jgi:hypothetical protein
VKETIRIIGAILFGIILISGALFARSHTAHHSESSLTSVTTDSYKETKDSDNDGIPDWKEHLTENVFATIETPTTTILSTATSTYTSPTTFTGKFAEAFLEDYMSGKINTTNGSVDSATLIENAVTAIESTTGSKTYSPSDIQTIEDTKEAFREYGDALGAIIIAYPTEGKNEMYILQEALAAQDP